LQIKPDDRKTEDVRTAYYTLSLIVNNLISEMEKYVDKGIRGFLKQMCYDMCKILKLTDATSTLDFHMAAYKLIPTVNDVTNRLCEPHALTKVQKQKVGEKMQSLFDQIVSVSRLYSLLDGSDDVDDGGMLQLHILMTEIIHICQAMENYASPHSHHYTHAHWNFDNTSPPATNMMLTRSSRFLYFQPLNPQSHHPGKSSIFYCDNYEYLLII
jgi:hypothetical protein